jgi:predicted porin
MQKKIIAAAVAGALALPAVAAYAQSSTVQIYGRITYEYGRADQGSGRPMVDYADSPGGSAIGFRGEEKLGGGLSAWFQCESSADVRALDQTGFCTRNSAVGLKGGFGNVFFGRWDTPLKRAMNVGTVGAEETGILGMSFLPFGGSGGSSANLGNNNVDAFGESQQRQRFKRREQSLSYYESPNLFGFQVMGAVSAGNNAADVANLDGLTNQKPRVWSVGTTFNLGPFGIGAGYEKHVDFGAAGPVATTRDLDDQGYGVSAAVTFGPVKVGATWLRREFETTAGVGAALTERELKQDTFSLGADWRIAGPHSVQAQWSHARDVKGDSLAGIGGNGGLAAPRVLVGGVEAARGETGGNAYSIAYSYAFSKRTRLKLGYVLVDNDDNTASYRIGNTAALLGNGQRVDGYAFHLSHSF